MQWFFEGLETGSLFYFRLPKIMLDFLWHDIYNLIVAQKER